MRKGCPVRADVGHRGKQPLAAGARPPRRGRQALHMIFLFQLSPKAGKNHYLSRFENYLSSLACVRKPDKAQKFLYLDFILSFLPKIWCSRAMIQLSLRTGKKYGVSFTIPNAGIDHRDK
jgi:hypothetical protein